ncbi:MAG: phosphatase PAP2 family protein [Bacteroidales bacterium]|nr:phosphatase PAP2 family protein [Bacteroidales bacterium]
MVCTSIIETLQSADQDITLLINSWSSAFTDGFWMMMSDKLFWIPTYLICVYFLFFRLGWRRALIVLASVGLAFALCDQFSNIVKHSVSRLRPSYSFRMLDGGLNILEGRGGFYGFFSAHAANSFATAMCLNIGFRNDSSHSYNAFCKWALVWAFLVSVSRIFVGKHYLGDVIVGALIGIAVGYLVGMIARYLVQKYVDKVPLTGLAVYFNKEVTPTAQG